MLVIDDEPAVRDLMQRFLTKEGFRVVTAHGGEEGLRLARELRPDAITLDVMMPGMDGWAVLSALKADPDARRHPGHHARRSWTTGTWATRSAPPTTSPSRSTASA